MKDAALDKMSTKDLKELRQRVEKMIGLKHDEERQELRDRFKQMAEEAGYSLGDIVGTPRASKTRSASKGTVKFANPENATQTWSGRGRMPNWLSERIKSGENLEQFRV